MDGLNGRDKRLTAYELMHFEMPRQEIIVQRRISKRTLLCNQPTLKQADRLTVIPKMFVFGSTTIFHGPIGTPPMRLLVKL